jgi:hypothetical protein
MTDATDTAVVMMLVVTGHNEDARWFRFKPGFFQPEYTIEWLPDSMIADGLPIELADVLIKQGYARNLNQDERDQYERDQSEPDIAPEPEAVNETEAPSRKLKRGERA